MECLAATWPTWQPSSRFRPHPARHRRCLTIPRRHHGPGVAAARRPGPSFVSAEGRRFDPAPDHPL